MYEYGGGGAKGGGGGGGGSPVGGAVGGAVGSGVAWKRAALAVARDGALFFTLYLLCVEALVGGEDEVAYIPGMKNGRTRTTGGEKDGWREMDGGYSVHSWVKSSDADGD